MDIERRQAETPRLDALSADLAALQGPCVGCTECKGLCAELIDAMVLPNIVLGRSNNG